MLGGLFLGSAIKKPPPPLNKATADALTKKIEAVNTEVFKSQIAFLGNAYKRPVFCVGTTENRVSLKHLADCSSDQSRRQADPVPLSFATSV